MTRMFWYAVMLALVLGAAAGVSWIIAYNTVNGVLGSPPPQMGNQTTTFLWDGIPRDPARTRACRFAFGHDRHWARCHASRCQIAVKTAVGITRCNFADQRQVERSERRSPLLFART